MTTRTRRPRVVAQERPQPPRATDSASRLPRVTEQAFQAQVERYARLCAWTPYHTYNSQRSAPGFPDLVLIRVGADGVGQLVVAELKTVSGKVSAAQEHWLWLFGAVPGVTVKLWHADDDGWRDIERTLGRAA